MLFGARDYDPTSGRWMAKDPIGFAGGDTDLYAYCGGDPVSFVDPTGCDARDTYAIAASVAYLATMVAAVGLVYGLAPMVLAAGLIAAVAGLVALVAYQYAIDECDEAIRGHDSGPDTSSWTASTAGTLAGALSGSSGVSAVVQAAGQAAGVFGLFVSVVSGAQALGRAGQLYAAPTPDPFTASPDSMTESGHQDAAGASMLYAHPAARNAAEGSE